MSRLVNCEGMNRLQLVLQNAGHARVGIACGVTRQAVKMWSLYARLPDTERLPVDHPRRTNYAAAIAKLAKCKRTELLDEK